MPLVVASITEELLFRGLILRGFLSRYSATKALLISAALFALVHLNPWQFFSSATLGVILGWWFLQIGNLVPCLIGHALHNGFSATYTYLPFEIPSFNAGQPVPVVFQPLWFNLIGLFLAALGLWMFKRMAGKQNVVPSAMPAIIPATPVAKQDL